MMTKLQAAQLHRASHLFAGNPKRALGHAFCEGFAPARVWVDDMDNPGAAIAVAKRFGIGFAAGDAARAADLLEALRGLYPWVVFCDPPVSWHPALSAWSPKSHATVRYAFGPSGFSSEKLEALAKPPEGCRLLPYDRALAETALSETWSEDQIGVFAGVDDFLARGFGFALVGADGALLSGCTSFCPQADGFDVQIDTHPDHRGRGYAACVGAAFVLECLRRGKCPHWDAANPRSLRLAERLGFRMTDAYIAWLLIPQEEQTEAVLAQAVGEANP